MRLIDANELRKQFSGEEHYWALKIMGMIDNAPTVTPSIAQVLAFENGKSSASTVSRWIPVKTRELTEEEREEYGEDICFMWDCPIPDGGQEVLVSTPYGVSTTFFADEGEDGKYFDGYDHEDILAWMPMPEPYKEADDEQ